MNYLIGLIEKISPSHKHKNYEIIVYQKGKGIFHSDGTDIAVYPGKIIIVPPGITHSSSCDGEFKRIYISGEFNQLFSLSAPTVILDNSEKEGLHLAEMIFKNRYSPPEYIASLTNAFAHFLIQNLKNDSEIGATVQEIISEITNNFFDPGIDLCAILNKSGYAEDYIRAQFKKITGKTPTEFLTNIRITHASYLIDTYKNTLTLYEIAEKCGYTDYVYFSRRFKHITGISPRTYMNEGI